MSQLVEAEQATPLQQFPEYSSGFTVACKGMGTIFGTPAGGLSTDFEIPPGEKRKAEILITYALLLLRPAVATLFNSMRGTHGGITAVVPYFGGEGDLFCGTSGTIIKGTIINYIQEDHTRWDIRNPLRAGCSPRDTWDSFSSSSQLSR